MNEGEHLKITIVKKNIQNNSFSLLRTRHFKIRLIYIIIRILDEVSQTIRPFVSYFSRILELINYRYFI